MGIEPTLSSLEDCRLASRPDPHVRFARGAPPSRSRRATRLRADGSELCCPYSPCVRDSQQLLWSAGFVLLNGHGAMGDTLILSSRPSRQTRTSPAAGSCAVDPLGDQLADGFHRPLGVGGWRVRPEVKEPLLAPFSRVAGSRQELHPALYAVGDVPERRLLHLTRMTPVHHSSLSISSAVAIRRRFPDSPGIRAGPREQAGLGIGASIASCTTRTRPVDRGSARLRAARGRAANASGPGRRCTTRPTIAGCR